MISCKETFKFIRFHLLTFFYICQMKSKTISKGILRAIGIIAGIVVSAYFLLHIKSVIFYIAISIVLSLIARPFIQFLTKYLKFSNTLAVVFSMLFYVFILVSFDGLIINMVMEQGHNLSLLDIEEVKEHFHRLYQEVHQYLLSHNILALDDVIDYDIGIILKHIPDLLNTILIIFEEFTIGLFSVLFISFFLMKDKALLNRALMAIVPDQNEDRFMKSFAKIKNFLSRYFIGLIFQVSILFIIYTIILFLLGVENVFVIAILVALLNLIPYIGPVIGITLFVFLTMTSHIHAGLDFRTEILPSGIWALIGYLFAQFIDNFISQPYIFSKSVKSHPLEVFLIIIIGGLLFGIVGMVLAIPVYTSIKVILQEFLADNKVVKELTKEI